MLEWSSSPAFLLLSSAGKSQSVSTDLHQHPSELQIAQIRTLLPTFRLSSAASSFFWISSREGSRRCGMEVLSSGRASKDGGLRMTSKAWPDVLLLSSITSTSFMAHQPRSTASVGREKVVFEPPQAQMFPLRSSFTFCFVRGLFCRLRVETGAEQRHQGELFDLLFIGWGQTHLYDQIRPCFCHEDTDSRVNLPLQCMESISGSSEVSAFVLRLHLPARVIFSLRVFLSGDAEDPVRSVSSTWGGGWQHRLQWINFKGSQRREAAAEGQNQADPATMTCFLRSCAAQ